MRYPMNIGEAAQAAGVTAKMIRHYEALGLIPPASRTEGGYRQYTSGDVAVLRFIRQSRSMGFSTKQIAQLLGLWGDAGRESREVKAIAAGHIAELDRRMAEMAQMKAALEALASDCSGDHRPDCPILGKLSEDQPPPRIAAQARTTPGRTARPPMPEARTDHAGLAAWMRSLNRLAVAEHVQAVPIA